MANGIPGLDVYEDDLQRSARPQRNAIPGLEVREEGLRRVGPSPEAQRFRAQRAAGIGPGPAPATPAAPVAAQPVSLRNALARGAQAAGRVAAPLAVAGAVGNQLEGDSTARYAQRFGVSEPTGDGSFGDIAKFAGLRAGGFATDLANIGTMGLAGKLFYRDADMPRPEAGAGLVMPPRNEMGDPTESNMRIPAPTLPISTATAAAPTTPRPDQRSIEGTVPTLPAGQILRTGNSYTSTGGPVGADAQVYNPDGTLRNQGPGGGRVSVLPTSEGYQADLRELGRLQAERAEREAGFAANQPGGGLSGIRSAANGPKLTRRERIAAEQNASQERIATGRDSVTARGQDIDARTAQARDAVTLRGQDMTARTAATAARVDQLNKDRQYQLDVQKFGVDQAEKNRTARAAEDEAVTKQLETRFRTTDDKGKDVADTARVAQYKQAVAATLPRLVETLKAKGDAKSAAYADELSKRGLAALDARDHDLFQQLLERRELARQTKSALYGGSNFTDSDNLFDFMQRGGDGGLEKGLRANRAVLANGSSVDERVLRYGADASTILPNWFGTENMNRTRGLRLE
jgi:hypothetical protein